MTDRLENLVALACLLLLGWLCVQLFLPFLDPLVWAAAIAASLHTPYRRLLVALKGRGDVAAALAVLLVTLLIVLPVSVLALMLMRESLEFYDRVTSLAATGELQKVVRLDHYPWLDGAVLWADQMLHKAGVDFNLQNAALDLAKTASTALMGSVGALAASAARTALQFVLMLVATFFLFRDGSRLGRWVFRLSPLGRDNDELIAQKFMDVASATMAGTLATGAAQGIVGGVLFAVLGVPNPLLWGTAMAFVSFVPAVGGALIWLPAAAWLALAEGAYWRAGIMVAAGALVVGSVDNLVKPVVMGQRAGLHSGLVLFSVLGGLATYGFTGLVLGPLLVALLQAFVQIYREDFAEQLRPTVSVQDG